MKNNLDYWEAAFLKDFNIIDDIPFIDKDAYAAYSEHNWIYDKYELLTRMNQPVWDLDKEVPSTWPCFVKPRFNFDGLGKDAFVAYSHDDIKKSWVGEGFIAQPYYTGQHESVDYVLHDGTVLDSAAFLGHKNARGEFIYWQSYPYERKGGPLLNLLSSGYDGFLNVEYIDGQVIEAHLRPSMQFYDIDGGLIKQYLEKRNNIDKNKYIKSSCQYAYSVVIPVFRNIKPKFPKLKKLAETVKSVQYCWEPGKYLSDSSQPKDFFRLLIINGTDLQVATNFGEDLRELILKESYNDDTFGRKK